MWVSLPSSSSASMEEVNAGDIRNDLVNGTDEQADEQSLSPEWSDSYDDDFGDPEISPRIGEEYQIEVPRLISKSEYCLFQRNVDETESTLHNFQVGLPIPIVWINDGAEENNDDPPKNKCNEEHRHKGQILVPGSPTGTWTEIQESSFLLGLYIFGKNFVEVKRFIGNKKMEDILSFYYGSFYKSNRYQRWAGCRKMKSRKCIFGQRIFTGPRQHELMSRLLPNVSEECKNKLLEVSKKFVEVKMPLEDYVLTLKALVGLEALVEGVGIGKGTQDLTGVSVDSVKSTQAIAVRPDIPVGKACSMLTTSEIISFLTGDFRLSKARTGDLFWEAVWPRLLAKGWHSEQPRSYNYATVSKNPLVFIVPGVKKFSRKLVKGNHYFDSLSDVLGKVASDPELIDLEKNADNNDCTGKEGIDRENSPADEPRHCYLKVKTPNRSADVMKFTVVDTSLASETTKSVRELRSLPFGVIIASSLETDSDYETTLEEEETNESESVNGTFFDSRKIDNIFKGESSDSNGLESKPFKEELPRSNKVLCTSLSASLIVPKTNISDNKCKRDRMKCQSLPSIASDDMIDLVPITKKRRLTACSRAKKNGNTASFFVVPRVKQEEKQEEVSFCLDPGNSNYNQNVTTEIASNCPYNLKPNDSVHLGEIPPQVNNNSLAGFPAQEMKNLAETLSNPNSIISRENVSDTSSSGTKEQHQKPKPRTMIDLNLPVSPEFDIDEPSVNEVSEIQKSDAIKESGEASVELNTKPVDHSDQQPDVQTRRTSTRNRPPTAKVLEALAFGYLDKKEKRDRSRAGLASKPSRRVSRKVEGSSSGSVADSEKEERASIVCNGNGSASASGNDNSDVLYTDFKQ